MRESKIEGNVKKFAEANGCLFLKLAGPNQKGQPDRMILRGGNILFMEFKAPGKTLDPLQRKWQDDLRLRGFVAEWVDNEGVAMDLIEKHLL